MKKVTSTLFIDWEETLRKWLCRAKIYSFHFLCNGYNTINPKTPKLKSVFDNTYVFLVKKKLIHVIFVCYRVYLKRKQ